MSSEIDALAPSLRGLSAEQADWGSSKNRKICNSLSQKSKIFASSLREGAKAACGGIPAKRSFTIVGGDVPGDPVILMWAIHPLGLQKNIAKV